MTKKQTTSLADRFGVKIVPAKRPMQRVDKTLLNKKLRIANRVLANLVWKKDISEHK